MENNLFCPFSQELKEKKFLLSLIYFQLLREKKERKNTTVAK